MARKVAPKMKAWLKFGYSCRKDVGAKPFKKATPSQKKKLVACVQKKARAAGMKIAGWK